MKRINKLGLLILFWAMVAPAQAGMVATPHSGMESSIQQVPLSAEQRRQTVRQLVDRGVGEDQAERRVAQMTDAQVLRLQGEIDTLPAGGMSTVNLLLIIILVILIV